MMDNRKAIRHGILRTLAMALCAGHLAMPPVAAAPVGATAPKAPLPASVKGTRILLLGTGAGDVIREKRSQPAILITVDGEHYLFDTGEGTLAQLRKAGIVAYEINRVFLTHLHFDHTAGLASLLAFNWGSGAPAPVEIFGPPGTQGLVKSAVDYFSISTTLFTPQLPPRPTLANLAKGKDILLKGEAVVYQDDHIRVLAVPNTHYSTLRLAPQSYGPVLSYSYRVETPTRVIVLSGDTGPSDAVATLARGADLLVSEVLDLPATEHYVRTHFPAAAASIQPMLVHMQEEHLTTQAVGKLAQRAGVKMVVLSHIGPGEDSETSLLNYANGVRQYFNGPVVVGKDLEEF